MAVIQLVSERPLCRARAARRLIDWYTQAAIRECAIAVQVLPEEVLSTTLVHHGHLLNRPYSSADQPAPESRPVGTALLLTPG